jgi:hypothetical protein
LTFFKIRSIVHLFFLCKGDVTCICVFPNPSLPPRHNDSKTFQIILNRTCGLPERVYAEWRRRSFFDLPAKLSQYRNPKTKFAAEAGAVTLIAYLKKKQSEGGARRTRAEDITVGEFAKDCLPRAASHLARWAAKGKILKRQTIIDNT